MLRRLWFNLAYYQKPIWDTGISPPELLDFINTHSPGRALDLGCGTGTNAITLAKSGWEVTGVDFAYRAIKLARNKAKQEKADITFKYGSVTDLKTTGGSYELVLDLGCFHSLDAADRSRYIENLPRLLAPGATFLLYVFLKPHSLMPGPGVQEADITSIQGVLQLVQRENGTEAFSRPSSWLTFINQR